jgi:hypothetical protein
MACPRTKIKLVGARFLVRGVMNHVLLRQRGFGLAKPKLALFVSVFYSHTLTWLPRVTKRKGLGMKFNFHVFLKGPK